jgi:hypothetical protein
MSKRNLSETQIVNRKIAGILDHLDSEEGTGAVAEAIPRLLAVLFSLYEPERREEGIAALCSDIRLNIHNIALFAAEFDESSPLQ